MLNEALIPAEILFKSFFGCREMTPLFGLMKETNWYVWIYIYTYTCIYIHTYICIYIYMCVCVCENMCMYKYVYMYSREMTPLFGLMKETNWYVYIYICVYICVCVCEIIHICICIYVYIYIYIYIYIYVCICIYIYICIGRSILRRMIANH
jgi:hypothetical protein